MTLFPVGFFAILVYVGIVMAALGGLFLLGLLIRDLKSKSVW